MRELILQIASGILGFWLACQLIDQVEFEAYKTLLLAGLVLGLINVFIKPVVKFVTTPLRILTFGLFGLAINMGIIWLVAYWFEGLAITGIAALFWTSFLLWGLSTILRLLFPKKKN